MNFSRVSHYASNLNVQRSIIMIMWKTQLQFIARQIPLLCNYKPPLQNNNKKKEAFRLIIEEKNIYHEEEWEKVCVWIHVEHILMRFSFNHWTNNQKSKQIEVNHKSYLTNHLNLFLYASRVKARLFSMHKHEDVLMQFFF